MLPHSMPSLGLIPGSRRGHDASNRAASCPRGSNRGDAARLRGSGTSPGASPAFSTSEGAFLTFDDMKGAPYAVEYDGRSFAVGGQRTLWLSGSVHPARVPPGEWAGTLRQMRRNGLNMVQVYVFWNAHEPAESGAAFSDAPGSTDWDVVDLKRFVSIAASEGLFVNLRIGPYVCAEWKFGGLPLWLMNATAYPDLLLRTNEPTWMRLAEDRSPPPPRFSSPSSSRPSAARSC